MNFCIKKRYSPRFDCTIEEFCDNCNINIRAFLLYDKDNKNEYKDFDLVKKICLLGR